MTKKAATKSAKKPAAGSATRKFASRKPSLPKRPIGYTQSPTGILYPADTLVPASKLARGFSKARKEIQSLLQEIVDTATQDFAIAEIELAASFNADGKFLGFGVGGEATMTIRIRPICA